MSAALATVRRMAIEGKHLHNCFCDQQRRQEGWKLMQRARRIAARLGYKLTALGIDF